MIRKNRKQLIISSVIIMLPVIAGLMMWHMLPDRMVTHWGAGGQADGWSSKAFAIFVPPLIMLALQWLCVFITAKDPKNKEQNHKVFRAVIWIFPIVSLLTEGIVYGLALGMEFGIDIIVRILLGLMFLILGNYMPKCKQNNTIGIKVRWTLKNEENWNKTHRFAGRIWVIGGLLLLATLFVPMKIFMYVLFSMILLLAFLPLIYSYAYYRKQLKAGNVSREDMKAGAYEKKWTAVSVAIGIVILSFAAIFLFTGDFEVQLGDTSFTIDARYWSDVTVSYDDIDHIEYRQQNDSGERTFGYGSFHLLMGEFRNAEFGDYTRYTFSKCDACVVLTVDDEILVINGKNEESTKEIYDEIRSRTEHQ